MDGLGGNSHWSYSVHVNSSFVDVYPVLSISFINQNWETIHMKEKRKRSKLAIASFLLGIGSYIVPLFLFIFAYELFLDRSLPIPNYTGAAINAAILIGFVVFGLALSGVITGIMALRRIKKNMPGRWMAWTGIIINALPLLWGASTVFSTLMLLLISFINPQ